MEVKVNGKNTLPDCASLKRILNFFSSFSPLCCLNISIAFVLSQFLCFMEIELILQRDPLKLLFKIEIKRKIE